MQQVGHRAYFLVQPANQLLAFLYCLSDHRVFRYPLKYAGKIQAERRYDLTGADTDQCFACCLLEIRDRVQADEFPLTHGFIAEMVGIRRASVTDSAAKLKARGMSESKRGRVKISDQQAMKKISCEGCVALKNEYDCLLDSR
jgi:CRP-like cAMP-binding protein